jgi:hypothetical protein
VNEAAHAHAVHWHHLVGSARQISASIAGFEVKLAQPSTRGSRAAAACHTAASHRPHRSTSARRRRAAPCLGLKFTLRPTFTRCLYPFCLHGVYTPSVYTVFTPLLFTRCLHPFCLHGVYTPSVYTVFTPLLFTRCLQPCVYTVFTPCVYTVFTPSDDAAQARSPPTTPPSCRCVHAPSVYTRT